MKISYSRYTAYLQNPERYRLTYELGLNVQGSETPTNFNYGKRRGSCFHEIQEARAKGVRDSAVTGRKWDEALYQRCVKLVEKVPGFGTVLLSEKEFELPIVDGKHSIIGRLDHIADDNGVIRVGDFKTTKQRTKKEMSEYFGNLTSSSQAHFYMHAASALGFPTDQFIYHVLVDEKDKPRYIPLDLQIGPAAIERTLRGVYAACEAIEGLKERIGVDNPWPHSNHWPCAGDKFFCGYAEICGRQLPKGCIPSGFVARHVEPEQETTEGN